MCFFKINGSSDKPKVADKDIICYKLIQNNGRGRYYNLYINGKLELWTKGSWYYESTPFRGYKRETFIKGNAFHMYKKLSKAKSTLQKYDYFGCNAYKIIILYIPKGALYFENNTQYCSSQIIYP